MSAEPIRENRLLLSRITSDQTPNGEAAGSSGIAARALGDFGNVNGEQLDERGAISDGNLDMRLMDVFKTANAHLDQSGVTTSLPRFRDRPTLAK